MANFIEDPSYFADPEKVFLKVYLYDKEVIFLRMTRTITMARMMRVVEKTIGWPFNSLKYYYDGIQLQDNDTPVSLFMGQFHDIIAKDEE
ncbi:Ubiquitin-like domain-containing protein [Caenorhabditis elegans]|nr:Ubiquitin-like domain-containing protein [Caenorhabditis elegans]VVC12348.1 Ubiquitin-like domain-containing protein [Caenorhabditis elegans]